MDHGGHQREWAGERVTHDLDQRSPAQGLHRRRGDDEVGNGPAHRVEGIDRTFISLDTPDADGGQHAPHQRQHGPAVVDNGDDERVEVTTIGAMVEHGTPNPGPLVGPTSTIGSSVVNGS
jgi:hypothetical protein